MSLKHSYQSGTANNAGSEVSSTNWNAEHLVDTTSATPASGKLALVDKSTTREMLAFNSAEELGVRSFPHFGYEYAFLHVPIPGSTTVNSFGWSNATVGTATAVSWANTNAYTRTPKTELLITTASTTAVAGRYSNNSQPWTVGGSAAGIGGFHLTMNWGPATGVATTTNRAFAGMTNTTGAPTDVEPSTITNIVGMGWDAADTNVQIMYRAAGAVNKIDLGASFPVPTVDRTTMYRLDLFSPPGTTQLVRYEVTNLQTGAVASGSISSNLPATSTQVGPRVWMSVGGTSSVIGVALGQLTCTQPIV